MHVRLFLIHSKSAMRERNRKKVLRNLSPGEWAINRGSTVDPGEWAPNVASAVGGWAATIY
jgi:hypothetical protein